MLTIKEIMKILPPIQRDTLMVAFESGNPHYIEWSPGRFLGVNTDSTPHLHCDQRAGSWREGTINIKGAFNVQT